MRLLFKFDGTDKNNAPEIFEQHFDTCHEALDYLDDLHADNPDNLLQNNGLALWGIVPDEGVVSQREANALEKVANYASLLIDGRATGAIKRTHKQLIDQDKTLLEYEFEKGNVTVQQLGVDNCERLIDKNPLVNKSARLRAVKKWLDGVKPDHKHKDRVF